MSDLARNGTRPELKALVREASQALAALDTARLGELAAACAALNAPVAALSAGERRMWRREAQDAVRDMGVLSRVLEATRANLHVIERLRELRMGRMEYNEPRTWRAAESDDGNH